MNVSRASAFPHPLEDSHAVPVRHWCRGSDLDLNLSDNPAVVTVYVGARHVGPEEMLTAGSADKAFCKCNELLLRLLHIDVVLLTC